MGRFVRTRVQLLCAWSGFAMLAGTLAGFLVAGVLPLPPAAWWPADRVLAFYTDSPTTTRVGFVLASMSVGLLLPLVGLLSAHLVGIEGRVPVLAFLQLLGGAVTGVMLLVPLLMMAVCAFRVDRDPALVLLLHDLAWLLLLPPVVPFMLQAVAVGVAVLGDRSAEPLMPRWVGYLNLWIAFLFLPGVLPFFFYSGPFAWQGVFVFWLALAAVGAWVVTMALSLRRVVLRDTART
ncbi:hypothetical protein [Pseudonocardia sp. NPDC049154]|uniref:hypothetical protein n=1 Tax=Pseudonocardia sp. NPDC049154 TaxID=3155501 RepID=UPI0033FA3F01